jgi:peptide/nickel transport system permease protein
MLTTLRDLLRYNVEFRIGAMLVGLVAVIAALSFVSPYSPIDTFVVPPDVRRLLRFRSARPRGARMSFGISTFAIRNTLALWHRRRRSQPYTVAHHRASVRVQGRMG